MNCTYHRYCHAEAVALSHTTTGMRHTLCDDHLSRRLSRNPSASIDPTFTGIGVVYLIHFDQPVSGHAGHYLGFTTNLDQRLTEHAEGRGSKLIAAANRAEIIWHVIRTWRGDRTLESKLKRQAHLDRLCPTCRPRGREERRTKRVSTRRYGVGYEVAPECSHRKVNKGCKRCKEKGLSA